MLQQTFPLFILCHIRKTKHNYKDVHKGPAHLVTFSRLPVDIIIAVQTFFFYIYAFACRLSAYQPETTTTMWSSHSHQDTKAGRPLLILSEVNITFLFSCVVLCTNTTRLCVQVLPQTSSSSISFLSFVLKFQKLRTLYWWK